ncbi:hypothetical protein [Luteimonas sp. 3794]|uniref:hypothetical protein n=1 Tax=Luteimonas sp. 3794 TaxID=2817730 RepID=UPI00285AB4B1|nr:hypothetical protein [Luteimonas sp. 3794]MDR6993322.1 hypothetical protein [Luteimonas sp. 3794]
MTAQPVPSMRVRRACFPLLLLALAGVAHASDASEGRSWLAGDHHVHSEWSVNWDEATSPPTPIRGGDSPYSRTRNAEEARRHGLTWMVHTDHGGPNHSAVTHDSAWPALQQARVEVPEVLQFHGMEFDVPAGEHASLIMAPGAHENTMLVELERRFNRREVDDDARDTPEAMLAALRYMQAQEPQPLMFVNHPSRTATAVGVWGQVEPGELRAWQDAAPDVLVGMEGAPGHQADRRHRGLYRNDAAKTWGGFDQMTAQLGGVWDTLLAEGRRFWITSTSDSHRNVDIGGADFWPGEYSKTYVLARHDSADVLDGLRHGRMFAVTGDLIDTLDLQVHAGGKAPATMGGTLQVAADAQVTVQVAVTVPEGTNFNGDRNPIDHIDVIAGQATADGTPDMTVHTVRPTQWQQTGNRIAFELTLPAPQTRGFVRVRGTSNAQIEPTPDVAGEDPWQDLWFYSNPVFVEVVR